jgi:4-hydroxybutyrate CoA-transferase
MDWKETYKSRVVSAEQAVQAIHSGDRVYLTGNCSVPLVILNALIKHALNLENVELCQPLTVCGCEYLEPELEGHLRVNSLFISTNVRQAINEGRADYTPVLLSELPLLFKRKVLPLDVALVHLSPPDEDGFCTMGIETGLTRTAAESAKIIIAEVNQQMPHMLGDSAIHVSRLDHIVPVDYALSELSMASDGPSDEIEKIASNIASLIPDGATMQLGIGAIPDAVLKYLFDKKDLGIHSELFSDGVIDLVNAGVLTGARKTLHPGKIIAGFLLGTNRLYQWADHNPLIELHRTEYVNNPFTVAQNARMVAINSAIEVDLTGQICADSIGPRFYSGVGGQFDFIYGASLSEGGIPIIALPSTLTTRDGKLVSRITTLLKAGAGVTTTRNHIHYVATEYGIVDLYGKTIRQRAGLLISIAHPAFRDELAFKAAELHYL